MDTLKGTLPNSGFTFTMSEITLGALESIRFTCYAHVSELTLTTAVTQEAKLKFEAALVELNGKESSVGKEAALQSLGQRDYSLLQLVYAKLNDVDSKVQENFIQGLSSE